MSMVNQERREYIHQNSKEILLSYSGDVNFLKSNDLFKFCIFLKYKSFFKLLK